MRSEGARAFALVGLIALGCESATPMIESGTIPAGGEPIRGGIFADGAAVFPALALVSDARSADEPQVRRAVGP